MENLKPGGSYVYERNGDTVFRREVGGYKALSRDYDRTTDSR